MRTTWLVLLVTVLAGSLCAQRPRQPRPAPAAGPAAADPTAPPVFNPKDGMPGARFTALSPDGKTVVFTLHGDIWSMPFGGGRATRLTLNEAYDTKPLITRDGKNVVFVSDRSGSYDLWVMPIDGGQPKRLTFHSAVDVPTGFTADGKQVIYQSTITNEWEIWRVPLDGGTPVQLTTTGGRDASTVDDGTTLFYVDGASDPKVQEYTGSANDRLYRQVKGKPPEHLAAFDGNSREPRIFKDGTHFYFTREVKGSFELFRYDIATGNVKQLTELGEDGMSGFDISTDEKTVVFVWKFFLYSLDLGTENAKPKLMPITIREDSAGPKIVERTFSSGAESADLSPDGRFICFELGGNLWIMTSDGGQAKMLTSGPARDQMPRFSPDSRNIAFFSNRTAAGGEVAPTSDIWVVGIDGRNLRQITNDPANDFFENWSPDGKAIVHCSERSGNRDIWLTPLDGSQPLQLTNSPGSDDDPSFSPDGRYIAFDSARENPNNTDLWIMSADGSGQHRVYGTPQIEECPVFSPDGKLLVFNRIVRGGAGIDTSVVITDLNGSGEVRVADGHYGKFTPDGHEVFYLGDRGEMFYARAPLAINTGRKLSYMASTREPAKETMLRAFDEAFMSYGMGFYDPNFHGKNWADLGRKYRALVETAQCQEELLFYLNRMVGELNASHSGAYPGGDDDGIHYVTGGIGMRLEPEAFREGRARLKVVDVEKGGPADRAWIRKGDYIFRIGNQAIGMKDDAYAMFENIVGREISLYVADNPNGDNFREVKMMPEHPGQKQQRDYVNFVTKCKAYSAQNSAGAVAYIHIPAMMPQALQNFINELASPQVQAARALVIDVRNNGGGNIHQQLVDILSRKKYAEIRLRDGRKADQAELYWDRPFVVMINERSYSDAEVFPHAIKTLKMGKIVGVPTPGAVIGTQDIVLSDGTRWRIPGSGFYDLDGTNQEHHGCQPDYLVEISPADKLAGKDPQLEKAVKVLLDQLRGNADSPVQPTTSPDIKPKKTGDFSSGQSAVQDQGERFVIKPEEE